ncbi:protein artichoke isoform X2 [Trichogramma pretiosum]|uniref:protein artichoke isoform X2 n=1 Tax=Trichogramma pretiosum TaxID=7493 RepID=UPI000C719CFE|nr:protein artichoke isoform X2 [Trichogramma pretiosum]
MSNSIFYSLLLALFVFELQSIGAIPPYLDSGENVVEDTTLVFNNNIDNADDHHSISADQDLLNKSINVESHVDESSSCSGISLDFSNMNIGYAVRNYFINGSYVQNLSLAHNKIEEFDNGAFDGLSNLKYLDLSYNKLSPTKMLSFGGHATLETLIFDYNEPVQQLEWYYEYGYNRQRMINVTLPISIPTSNIYPKLKNLSLRGTSIIPSFDNWDQSFPSLEKLDLSYVNLESVTNSEFSQSFPSSVKILILQSTSLQTAIFDNLSNLEELDVTGNSFENGLGFLNCPNLKKLNLFNTRIDNVPSDLNDQCQNIEELNMGENRIEDIDSSAFENLNKLKVLDLSNNPLKKIDFIASLSQLNTLKLNGMPPKLIESLDNMIFTIYEPNLKYLSIRSNGLANLPEKFIKLLTSLEEIDLSDNNLSSVPKLPTMLKSLNLQNNNINYLDDNLLRSLINLKEIKLGKNPIKQLEIELISNLPKSCILNWE